MIRIDFQSRGGKDTPFRLIYLVTENNLAHVERAFDTFFGFRMEDASFNWKEVAVDFKRDTLQDKDNNEIINAKLGDLIDETEGTWHVIVPFISRAFLTEERFKADNLNKSMVTRARRYKNQNKATIEASTVDFYDFNRTKKPLGFIHKSGRDTGAFKLYGMKDGDVEPKPKSLVAMDWVIGMDGQAFPETAYLRDKDTYHQPICNACPRRMLHEMGECNIGDPVCYLQLKKYNADTFVDHYAKYRNLHRLCKGGK